MELLKELNLEENTLVIFLTDNGPNGQRYNGGMKGIKGSVHEGGVRVPSFWKWPGKIKPGIITSPAAHIDILPTISGFLGISSSVKNTWDGISLTPLFQGKAMASRAIYSHVAQLDPVLKDRPGSIRKDSLLLTLLPSGLELYDLKNDPKQEINLLKTHPKLGENLEKDYQDWFKEVSSGISMERKIPVSKRAAEVVLPAFEGQLYGKMKFFEGHGWAQDWVTNWKEESDSISWNLEVLDPGWYEIWMDYTALPTQAGSRIKLKTTLNQLSKTISTSFIPKQIPSPDRVPRKEAPEQTWNKMYLGKTELKLGSEKITLSAIQIKPEGFGDIFSLRLVPLQHEKQ
jgi:arylsulfatase A